VPYFICPNCRERSIDHDRQEGLTREAVACHRCGFGFLFELLDDYYPAPGTGFVVCDQQRRILAPGGRLRADGLPGGRADGPRGDGELGSDGLRGRQKPARSWRSNGACAGSASARASHARGQRQAGHADFFPAYDDDGGLLVAITPRS
jgi:hypothetical protein